MGHVGRDVQGLQRADLAQPVSVDAVFEKEVAAHGGAGLRGELRSEFVDSGALGVVGPENCVPHGKASSERLFGIGVDKGDCVLSLVRIGEKGVVAAHGLGDKDGRLPARNVSCTRDHVVHPESILGLQPNGLRLSQIMREHHHVAQPQRPLETQLRFLH